MSTGAGSRGRLAGLFGPLLRYGLLGLGAALMVLPFVDMFLGALRTPAERLARPPVYLSADPQWWNFVRVFTELPAGTWLFNSVFVTLAITAAQLLTSAMAGYALAKFRFPLRDTLFRTVLGAQMFPFFLFVIPIFVLMRYAPLAGGNDLAGQGGSGLLGTYAALILPFAVSWYGIFLMRQFMLNVPDDILDAARMDGAGEARIFFQIVLPLVAPGLVKLAIFVFVYQWNEVIWTMTVTRSAPELQTLPVGIYLMRGAFTDLSTQSLQQAAVAVSVLPVMIVFAFLQRFQARGTTAGSGR